MRGVMFRELAKVTRARQRPCRILLLNCSIQTQGYSCAVDPAEASPSCVSEGIKGIKDVRGEAAPKPSETT
jgi:hypothetical protein